MNNRFIHLLLLLGLCASLSAQRRNINADWQFMRLSEETSTAEIKNQGSDWSSQYNVEHVSAAISQLQVAADTLKREFSLMQQQEWEQVRLPHTPFIEELTVLHQWQGICYYKRTLRVTPEEAAGRLWIEFEGAMHLADVWVNGQHLMQHAGGYTPFVVDVSDVVKANQDNEILVRLDNRNNPLIPPGKPLERLDFCYFGGLYRDVNLIVKPKLHITHPILSERQAGGGVFITYPEVSEQQAKVRILTEVENQEEEARKVTLRNSLYEWSREGGQGKRVTRCKQLLTLKAHTKEEVTQQLAVSQPRLWSPDSPNLYVMVTELLAQGKVIDREEHRIGIRHIEMSRERGFVINGKPLRLVGSNRHMEYPYVGNAISDNAQYRDIYHIRSNGFNIVRLGHYPQDPSVLDACDELGLLAIEPIPGWQFFNKNPLFQELTFRDVRHTIRRDRNHPSIVMWETTLNESWPPAAWKDQAVKVAHEEYPGDQCFTSGDAYGYEGFDVSYNNWEEGFNRPNPTKNPGFIREYYDYEFGGHYSTTRIRRGDGEQAQIQNAWNAQWSHNRYRSYYPWTMGDAVWSMYDYNRGCCDNICYSGLADLFRLPKFGLSFFRTQQPAGSPIPSGAMPYELFIPSYRDELLSDTLLVYGNVEEVELLLNGTRLARQQADRGSDTEYVAHPDGGNCAQLAFPPFTFARVPRERGVLKAIGYVGGQPVAEAVVRSPEKPAQLEISYFESGRPAAQHDLLIIHVRVKDQWNTLCPLNGIPVTLQVKGGQIVGPSTYPTEMGVASFLVWTEGEEVLQLEASGQELTQALSIPLKGQSLATRKPIEWHVAVDGDDEAAGTAAAPWRHIQTAADRALPGDIITVHGGIYRERVAPSHGGDSPERPIVFQAAPGEQVEIKGSEVVKGWKRIDEKTWVLALPNQLFGAFNPFQDLIHGDWLERGKWCHTGEVYLNDVALNETPALENVMLNQRSEQPLWYSKVEKEQTWIWANFFGVDPNRELVEINVRQAVFYPRKPFVNYITVRGFTLSQAATPWAPPTAEQIGLIGTHWSKGWVIEHNVVKHAKCVGITLGKYGDEWDNKSESVEGYIKTTQRALNHGWNRQQVGSHHVHHNHVSHCGQAGICGSLGAIFSTIEENIIHDISRQGLFWGYELAGLKLHGAVDALIRHNHIYRTEGGIWLDWMTQGTRITRNLLHDNDVQDFSLEVNHGPILVDNNLFLSPQLAQIKLSQGVAFVHNTMAWKIWPTGEVDERATPYLLPHDTQIAGYHNCPVGNVSYRNNLLTREALSCYTKSTLPVQMEGNRTDLLFSYQVVEEADGWYLQMTYPETLITQHACRTVDSKLLLEATIPQQPICEEQAHIHFQRDYLNRKRSKYPTPGALELPKGNKLNIKIYTK